MFKTQSKPMTENTAIPINQTEVEGELKNQPSAKIGLPNSDFFDHERKQIALKESEARYRRLFETAKHGILILDGDYGRITDVNPFLLDLLGYSKTELIGKQLWEIGSVKDIVASQEAMRHLQNNEYIRYENLLLETKAGERKQVEFVSNVYLVNGRRVTQCNIRDITERKHAEVRLQTVNNELLALVDELRQQAIHDPLTGLFNRRYLDETLPRELHMAQRRNVPLCVVMLDLDGFKQFNDSFGHGPGDSLLREFGRVLRAHLRKSDISCRYGGDEFVLVLPDSSIANTRERVEQIRIFLKELPVHYGEQVLGAVTLSAGIVQTPEHGTTSGELLRMADEAMYAAKRAGRDRMTIHKTRE